MTSEDYKLDLSDKKKNIFVTQLADREYEYDENVNAFPVVKESASRLIDTGIKTLQKTLLLKKEVEIDGVQRQLYDKRLDFKTRMEAAGERRIELQKKQQKMKDRVSQHERFIKDVEAKRRRAVQKYEGEVRMNEQKTSELEQLGKQLEELKQKHAFLWKKLSSYKRYEQYLLRVVDAMPENYIEMQDNMLLSLMMRHQTLSETNKDLVAGLTEKADELEDLKNLLEKTKQEHEKSLLGINSRLHQLQKIQEDRIDANQEREEIFMANKSEFRRRRAEIGVTLMAINNIVEKTTKLSDRGADRMSIDEKLQRIGAHLKERMDVSRIASGRDGATTPDHRSRGSQNRATPTQRETKVKFAD